MAKAPDGNFIAAMTGQAWFKMVKVDSKTGDRMSPDKSASRCLANHAPRSPRKSAHKSQDRNAKMSQDKSARMFLKRPAIKYLSRTAHLSIFVLFVNSLHTVGGRS